MKKKHKQTLYTYTSGITDAIGILERQRDEYGDIASIADMVALLVDRNLEIEKIENIKDFDGWVRSAGGNVF